MEIFSTHFQHSHRLSQGRLSVSLGRLSVSLNLTICWGGFATFQWCLPLGYLIWTHIKQYTFTQGLIQPHTIVFWTIYKLLDRHQLLYKWTNWHCSLKTADSSLVTNFFGNVKDLFFHSFYYNPGWKCCHTLSLLSIYNSSRSYIFLWQSFC